MGVSLTFQVDSLTGVTKEGFSQVSPILVTSLGPSLRSGLGNLRRPRGPYAARETIHKYNLSALYIDANHTYVRRPDLSVFFEGLIESLFVELVTSCNTSLLIGVVYCPKGVDINVIDKLIPAFESMEASHRGCIIMGDFNCNLMSSSYGVANTFINMIHSYAFEPIHTLPTGVTDTSATLLDNILINISQPCVPGILEDDISDHFHLFFLH